MPKQKFFLKILFIFFAFLALGATNAFAQSAQIELAGVQTMENYESQSFMQDTQYPTMVGSGITNNILSDSFLIPLSLILLGSWLYFTKRIHRFSDWVSKKVN